VSDAVVERKLTTILAADVVGYSRLMGEDEAGTLARLKSLRKELVQPKIAGGRGRIVKLMGDGLLAEFPSVVEAVRCAVDIQQDMAGREAGLPDERRIRLRIGVNLGDIIVEGSDIYGDGVNVAARLEGLAEPGGICISGKVYEEVRNKLATAFEDLGEQEVKNIREPVRVYRWTDAAADPMPSTVGAQGALPLPDKPSIAVLPFTNMSEVPDQEYFADGITEDIITELSRFRDLFVIARNSSFSYKGRSVKVQDIGADLGVAFVVEGSVRKASGRVRVTAQLVEAATGNHVWAERYDRDLEDIFAIQDQVTQAIVTALTRRLETTDIDRAMRGHPQNLAGYDLYLRGRHIADRFSRKDIAEARKFLKRATELDPEFARAQSYFAWLTLAETWWQLDAGAELDEALTIARRAVELDRKDSLCHSILGIVHLFRLEFEQAEACMAQAEALNPNDYWEGMLRCHILCHLGRAEEALASIRKMERYEPFPPNWLWDTLGITLYDLGRFDEAASAFQRMPNLNYWNHAYLAAAYGQVGQMDKAQKHLNQYQEMCPFDPMQFDTVHKNSSDQELWLEGLRKAGLSI
jgi:adenylate cyclase